MNVIVVRHGQTEGNRKGAVYGRPDQGLSDVGKVQAQRAARRLSAEPIAAIYCSNLRRCMETAEAIRPYHPDVPLAYMASLREISGGAMHRLPLRLPRWLLSRLVQLAIRLNLAPPGGESWRDLRLRVADILDEIYRRHPNATVLLVTHNVVIQAVHSLLKAEDGGPRGGVVPNCATMRFTMTGATHYSEHEVSSE